MQKVKNTNSMHIYIVVPALQVQVMLVVYYRPDSSVHLEIALSVTSTGTPGIVLTTESSVECFKILMALINVTTLFGYFQRNPMFTLQYFF